MEQALSGNVQHVQDNWEVRPSQHGLMKGRSCWADLIFFCDKMTRIVDEGKPVHVVYLGFRKLLDIASSLTAFSWRNRLLMAWMGLFYSG